MQRLRWALNSTGSPPAAWSPTAALPPTLTALTPFPHIFSLSQALLWQCRRQDRHFWRHRRPADNVAVCAHH